MFVVADPADLRKDLEKDIEKIKAESDRSAEMQKNFEAKKLILTQQLNDLTPKAKWTWIYEYLWWKVMRFTLIYLLLSQ